MPTQITPYSTTPSRLNPATFSSDRDIRLAEENSRLLQMNAQALENDEAVTTTTKKALEASNSASLSAQSANSAAQSATNATNNGATQVTLATTKANEASESAAKALASKNAIAGLITLLPTDVNLAYNKAAIDSKLELRDLENFLSLHSPNDDPIRKVIQFLHDFALDVHFPGSTEDIQKSGLFQGRSQFTDCHGISV